MTSDKTKISLIAAMGENRVIGANGKIPWHLSADFKRFKELTMGHPVIMGRKTFDSIGKPLPGRTNILITQNADYKAEGCTVVGSFDEALKILKDLKEIFVIGGEQIFKLAMPMASTIYLTKVQGVFEGDTYFPEFNKNEWKLVEEETHEKDEKNSADYIFYTYRKI